MVKADVKGYVDIVGFFYNEDANGEDEAIRTAVVENQCESASSHKLNALHEEGILDKWQKGNGKAYPVKEVSGDRIDGEKAERLLDSWFPDLVSELRDAPGKLEEVEEELDDEEKFEELAQEVGSDDLSDKVSASKKLLEAVRESGIEVETNRVEIGFRNPSNRWYLKENYVELFDE